MFGRAGVFRWHRCAFYQIIIVPLHQNSEIIMKKKDIFSKVEAEARQKLKHPDTRGAAQTVLEFIEKERKKP